MRWIAFLLLTLGSGQVFAEPVRTCVTPLAEPAAVHCDDHQASQGQGSYLAELRFALVSAEAGDPLVLRMSALWQRDTRIRFGYADGAERVVRFDSQSASRFLTIGSIWEVPVPWRAAALRSVRIEVYDSANVRGVVNGAEIVPRSAAERTKDWLIALYAGFAGLALALVVYNLSLWTAMRHRFQLDYCGMVLALCAYTFSASGLVEMAFPALDNNLRLRFNYLLLAIFCVTALGFVRNFFEPKVFGPRLARALDAVCLACLGVAVVYAWAWRWPVWQLDLAYSCTMLAVLSMIVPIVVSARRNRSRYVWLFVVAWSPPVAVSLLRIAHGFHFVGYSFMLDNGNLIAMAAEALLSSVMMTVRLRELSLERDHAIAGEQVARRLANTDPLTGLLNRRAFIELAIGRRSRHRLMLIDIDHFKAVNDRFGHDAGDDVLRAVADAIQRSRPARSLAVRLGGEEFALLIPRSAFGECPAEKVLDAVRGHAMPQGAQVTVSIGYADGTIVSEEDWKRLYRLADSALYRAKSDGRDRACRATDFSAAA